VQDNQQFSEASSDREEDCLEFIDPEKEKREALQKKLFEEGGQQSTVTINGEKVVV
jgi:hypothetical protein